MPAAVAIPIITAAASGGAAIYGAHESASASQHGIDAQTKSAQQALAVEKAANDKALQFQIDQRNYDRQAAALAREDYFKRTSPYVQIGNQAYGKLSGLLGLNAPSPFQSTGAPAVPSATPAISAPAQPPAGGSLSGITQPTAPTAPAPSYGTPGPTPQGIGGVQMIAPTGEVGMVPFEHVAAATAAGARRLQ